MELIDTVNLMMSDNYIVRMHGEYIQLDIRIRKLTNALTKYYAGEVALNDRDVMLMKNQLNAMRDYKMVLQERIKCAKKCGVKEV